MKRNRTFLWIIFGMSFLGLLYYARNVYLETVFQSPSQYIAKIPGGIESLQMKQFGALKLRLLPTDKFILVTDEKGLEDSHEVWIMLSKRIPLYAQFSNLTIERDDTAWSGRKAIQDAVLVWEQSFLFKKIEERFFMVQNQMHYEGLFQDQMGEVIVNCLVNRNKNNVRLLIIRGPAFQRALVDSITSSVIFE